MKLRNKKTGEIGYLNNGSNNQVQVARNTGYNYKHYDTLAELVEEWEDAPESKEHWFIGEDGNPHTVPSEHYIFIERIKEIGNYFVSEEEARRAVEKLKAWKRLKDKGFRFKDYTRKFDGFKRVDGSVFITAELDDEGCIGMIDDLDICFGGEE